MRTYTVSNQDRVILADVTTKKYTVKPWLVWLSGSSVGLLNQRVAGSIPSQGTCLGCGPGPQ